MIANSELTGLHADEKWSGKVLWVFCFALLLPVALIARATGWRWQPWSPGANGYQSAFKEANGMTDAVVAITFSSY